MVRRGYSKAFFATNQFVRDKERAALEDDLRKEHGIVDWHEGNAKTYALVREQEWDADERRTDLAGRRDEVPSEQAREESNLRSRVGQLRKHTDLRTVSLIRDALWNEAGWSGVAYLTLVDDAEPPTVLLMFRNEKAAEQIFQGWREDLGSEDKGELLRLSAIRGISAAHPAWYRMHIGAEPAAWKADVDSIEHVAIVVSRIHTMEPATSENLDRFLSSYAVTKSYVLAPAVLDLRNRLRPATKVALTKRMFHVRDAWSIGPNDPDITAIHNDDDVVIPAGAQDVPFRELQRSRADRRRNAG